MKMAFQLSTWMYLARLLPLPTLSSACKPISILKKDNIGPAIAGATRPAPPAQTILFHDVIKCIYRTNFMICLSTHIHEISHRSPPLPLPHKHTHINTQAHTKKQAISSLMHTHLSVRTNCNLRIRLLAEGSDSGRS